MNDILRDEVGQTSDFNLTLNEARMERSLSPEDKMVMTEFFAMLASGNVDAFFIGTKRGEVVSLGLETNDGETTKKLFVSSTLFESAVNNVGVYREDPMDDPTGLLFKAQNGEPAKITPDSSPEEAKEVISNFVIEGHKLNKDIKIRFIPITYNTI